MQLWISKEFEFLYNILLFVLHFISIFGIFSTFFFIWRLHMEHPKIKPGNIDSQIQHVPEMKKIHVA